MHLTPRTPSRTLPGGCSPSQCPPKQRFLPSCHSPTAGTSRRPLCAPAEAASPRTAPPPSSSLGRQTQGPPAPAGAVQAGLPAARPGDTAGALSSLPARPQEGWGAGWDGAGVTHGLQEVPACRAGAHRAPPRGPASLGSGGTSDPSGRTPDILPCPTPAAVLGPAGQEGGVARGAHRGAHRARPRPGVWAEPRSEPRREEGSGPAGDAQRHPHGLSPLR